VFFRATFIAAAIFMAAIGLASPAQSSPGGVLHRRIRRLSALPRTGLTIGLRNRHTHRGRVLVQ
jgi:hypothetical protein